MTPICIHAQITASEKQSVDSIFKIGKLNSSQTDYLYHVYSVINYPEFKVNSSTGEVEISDTLIFGLADKILIFERCLEWVAINYGSLVHSNLEYGKVISQGLIDLNHFEQYTAGFGSKNIQSTQTSTNYTLILTIKDNKVKYLITNINYNFRNFSETIDEISYPLPQLYPVKIMGPQWVKFFTLLNATSEMFNTILKKSLVNYINDAKKDYQF